MRIVRTDGASAEFRALVGELDKELWERYPDTMHSYVGGNIVDDEVRVVVSYEGDEAVGCGCLREFEGDRGTIELKRMFVRRDCRGKGHSVAIVQELVAWAAELGFEAVRLETGTRQPEAIRLYEKTGFRRIPNYGGYVDDPESVCMERRTGS